MLPPTRSSSSSSSTSLTPSVLVSAFRSAVAAAEVQIKRCSVPVSERDEHDDNANEFENGRKKRSSMGSGSPRGVNEIGPQHRDFSDADEDPKGSFVTSAMGMLRSSFSCTNTTIGIQNPCTKQKHDRRGFSIWSWNYPENGNEEFHKNSPGRTDAGACATPQHDSGRIHNGRRNPDNGGWEPFVDNPFPKDTQPPNVTTNSKVVDSNFPADIKMGDEDTGINWRLSISELTMRSSYGAEMQRLFITNPVLWQRHQSQFVPHPQTMEGRRMAYYAVGKSSPEEEEGNDGSVCDHRRCYFTGQSICTPEPFYAGLVQQGSKTLVVFCLPSAIMQSCHYTMDGNYQAMLDGLPVPNNYLLDLMKECYPEQYATLPMQVRIPTCWRIYTRFCYFSGLPILEGELHYRVKEDEGRLDKDQTDGGARQILPEEVILSHDVMVAVLGQDSSDILKLPNQHLFIYLKIYYPQQSSKLSDKVFHRSKWEKVHPEC